LSFFVDCTSTEELHWLGSNAPFCRSLVVCEERMKPVHWLGSVPFIPFCAFTLLIGYWVSKNPVPLLCKDTLSVQVEEQTDGNV